MFFQLTIPCATNFPLNSTVAPSLKKRKESFSRTRTNTHTHTHTHTHTRVHTRTHTHTFDLTPSHSLLATKDQGVNLTLAYMLNSHVSDLLMTMFRTLSISRALRMGTYKGKMTEH